MALGIGLSKPEAEKAAEYAAAEEERKCLPSEDACEDEKQMIGHQQEMWYKIWMLR